MIFTDEQGGKWEYCCKIEPANEERVADYKPALDRLSDPLCCAECYGRGKRDATAEVLKWVEENKVKHEAGELMIWLDDLKQRFQPEDK